MSILIQFTRTQAIPLHKDPAQVLVRWQLAPNREDLSDYEFYVERGDAPDAIPGFQNKTIDGRIIPGMPSTDAINLETVAGPIQGLDLHEFFDYTPALRNLYKDLVYRIRCRKISTQEEIFSPMVSWAGDLDLVGLYIADETNFLLEDSTGEPCFIYRRRRNGVYCPSCFDKVQQKRLSSKCVTCYDTNWVGGYHKAIDAYVDLDPDVKESDIKPWGEDQTSQKLIKLGNFPILANGDFIRELRQQRLWRIGKVRQTEKRRVPLLQWAEAIEIKPGDIEYQLPYDEVLACDILKRFDEIRFRREF